MKPSLKRFAPLALYLSLIATIAAIGLAIVMRSFNIYVQISLALIVIGIALYAIINPEGVRNALTGRQARYGSNALVFLIAAIGIIVVINYVVAHNGKRWDLTEDQEHTLADETLNILGKLENDVSATAYYTSSSSSTTAENLLEEFAYNANGHFTYSIVDPNEDPVSANNDGITRDGTIVFKIEDRKELVTTISEEEMISAVVRLSNPGERTVYFLSGHGEHDPDGSSDDSYSSAKEILTNKNYTVESLSLLVDQKIPDDALALIIAGYTKPYSDAEVSLIKDYLDNGGSLVVLMEPLVLTDFEDQTDPLTQMLVDDYGFTFSDDLIIDTGSQMGTLAIAGSYGSSPIVNEISSNNLYTVFPTARSIDYTDTDTETAVRLINTSSQTWSETDLDALKNNQATYDEGVDTLGPITLGVSMENTSTNSRLVVFGDSEFADNTYIDAYGNSDLFANIVDWAANQDDLISLTAKETTSRFMSPPEGYLMRLILLASIVVLPGGVAIAGIVNLVQRRRRG